MAYGYSKSELTFVGMTGIIDPPREGVRDAVTTLLSTGISLKMVTGDAEETALAIGKCFCTFKTENFNVYIPIYIKFISLCVVICPLLLHVAPPSISVVILSADRVGIQTPSCAYY